MKHLLRIYLIHVFVLWLNTIVFKSSFSLTNNLKVILLAALVLTILNSLLKPVLKLLFFPINLLTLGLFSLVINMGIFYLMLYLIPSIGIQPWLFQGFTYQNFSLPEYKFDFWSTLFIISTFTSITTNFLIFLVK